MKFFLALILLAGSAAAQTIRPGGVIRFMDADGSHYSGIRAPTSVTTSYDLYLPPTAGTAGQALITDGSGNLSWSLPAIPATLIPYGNGSGVLTTEAGFEYIAGTDQLRVGNLQIGGAARDITLYSPAAGHFAFGEGVLNGDELVFDMDTDNQIRLYSGSGVSLMQFDGIGLSYNVAPRSTPTAMDALEVDLTKALNTKTISGNVTITFSGSLANGQWSELRVQNSGVAEYTVSWAIDSYDGNTGDLVSSFTVPAAVGAVNGRRHVVFSSDGTNMLFYEGGSGGGGTGDAVLVGGNAFTGDQSVTGNITASGDIGALTISATGALSGDLTDESLPAVIPAREYETITTAKAIVHNATNAVGNVIVTTNAWTNMQADGAAETMTYSGVPTEGTSFGWIARDFAGDALPTVFTLTTSTYSQGLGSNRTSFSVPEGKFVTIIVDYLNGTYSMSGETVFISDLPAHAAPTGSYLVETHDPTAGASGKSTLTEIISANNIKTTRTGVRRTMYVNAGAMIPRTTAGAASGTVELATNDIMYDSKDFDTTTEEGVGFWLHMPPTWNAGAVTAKFQWSASGGTAAETVVWNIAARGFADDDAMDQALGTEQAASDALIATGDMHISATTPAITVGGSVAAGYPVYFQITRDTATDTLAADALLLGVVIEYTESSTEPSAQ